MVYFTQSPPDLYKHSITSKKSPISQLNDVFLWQFYGKNKSPRGMVALMKFFFLGARLAAL
jgi:hypothetical protein